MLLFGEPFQRRFEAPLTSGAGCFFIFCLLIILVVPFIICYTFGGFWLKQGKWREQPVVNFEKELIVNLYGDDTIITWSSNPVYNKFRLNTLEAPIVKTTDIDTNFDGKIDWIDFSISIPLKPTDTVKSVRVAFFLHYQLSSEVNMTMQTLAIINEQTGMPASSLNCNGVLKFRQYRLIPYWKDRNIYSQPIINWTAAASDPSLSSWTTLLNNYMERNDRTLFQVEYPVWKWNRAADQPFVISGRINILEDEFAYLPSGQELFKYAWIQYLSFVILVAAIVFPIMGYVFRTQMVQTFIRADRVPATNGPAFTRVFGADIDAHVSGKSFKQYGF